MKYPRITIHGQPPSKSNRKGITKTGHYYKPNTVKLYEDAFFLQCPLRGTTSNPPNHNSLCDTRRCVLQEQCGRPRQLP